MARATAANQQRLDIPATTPRAHQPFVPHFDRSVGTVESRQVCGICRVLMAARLAPNDQMEARLGGMTKGHRSIRHRDVHPGRYLHMFCICSTFRG